MGRDRDGEATLLQGLSVFPDEPNLLHARGLQLVRVGNMDEALDLLARSVELAPGVPRYAYVLAIGQNSAGDSDGALVVVRASLERHPFDRDLLSLAVSLHQDRDETTSARGYASRLLEVAPHDPDVQRLARQMGLPND